MPKRKRSKSKSGYFGVFKVAPSGRYQAKIKIDGKFKYLGTYDTANQAAEAYDDEAIKLGRPFSKLNYPKQTYVGYTPIQQPLYSQNTVGYRGVTKIGKKFKAQIRIGSKTVNLGTYETAKEAAVAYDRAALKANQSTTLLNFPDMVHNLDVEPKRKKRKRSSTGYRGVTKNGKKFAAMITIAGKLTYIGIYETAKEAAVAYDQAAINAGKKNSKLNFPVGLPIKEKEKKSVKDGGYIVDEFIIQSYL